MKPCSCVCHRGMFLHPFGEFCCINAIHAKVESPPPGQHEPLIDRAIQGIRALCKCGWRTDFSSSLSDVENQIASHKRKTAIKTEPSIWERG